VAEGSFIVAHFITAKKELPYIEGVQLDDKRPVFNETGRLSIQQ